MGSGILRNGTVEGAMRTGRLRRMITAILALALLTLPGAPLRHAAHASPQPCAAADAGHTGHHRADHGADHAPADWQHLPVCCVLGGCAAAVALPVLAPVPALRPQRAPAGFGPPATGQGIAPRPPLHPPRAAA